MAEKIDKHAAPPDEWPKRGASSNGTDTLYSVEARLAYVEPKTICGITLDTRWRKLSFAKTPIGVPNASPYSAGGLAGTTGLLGFPSAQALMWWFRAQASLELDDICLETRIVAHRIKWQWSEESVAASEAVTTRSPEAPRAPKQEAADHA